MILSILCVFSNNLQMNLQLSQNKMFNKKGEKYVYNKNRWKDNKL